MAEQTAVQQPAAPSEQTIVQRLANFVEQQNPGAFDLEQGQPVHQPQQADATPEGEQPPDGEQPPEQEAQPPEQEDEGSITIDPSIPMFDVTVKTEGGKDEVKKVSLSDLESGYMMQADYQRKTQELSRARQEMTAEVQKMIEPERQQYVQTLGLLQETVMALVAPELKGVNWETLSSDDPAQYVKLSAKAQKIQQVLGTIEQQQKAAQDKSRNEVATYSRKMLEDPVKGIPGWNGEVYNKLINETSKALEFHPDEVAQVVDYRMLKTLFYAQKYLELQASKPEVTKKVSVAPKVLKPGRPAEQSDLQAKTEKELNQRLRKSGDLKDAAALYLSRQSARNRQ